MAQQRLNTPFHRLTEEEIRQWYSDKFMGAMRFCGMSPKMGDRRSPILINASIFKNNKFKNRHDNFYSEDIP